MEPVVVAAIFGNNIQQMKQFALRHRILVNDDMSQFAWQLCTLRPWCKFGSMEAATIVGTILMVDSNDQ